MLPDITDPDDNDGYKSWSQQSFSDQAFEHSNQINACIRKTKIRSRQVTKTDQNVILDTRLAFLGMLSGGD